MRVLIDIGLSPEPTIDAIFRYAFATSTIDDEKTLMIFID